MRLTSVKLIFAASLLALIAVVMLDRLVVTQPGMVAGLHGSLSKTQEKSIDLLADLAHLVITVATGLLGLLTYYVRDQRSSTIFASPAQASTLALATCSALASIYFGHGIISALAEMLANDYFLVTDNAVARAVVLQYLFLCAAVIGTIWFVVLRSTIPKSDKD